MIISTWVLKQKKNVNEEKEMANWCTNDVIFHGEKTNILAMWVLINQAFEEEFKDIIRTKFDADGSWCGYLAFMFGGSVDGVSLEKGHLIEDPTSDQISCRGFLQEEPQLSPDKKSIRFFVESAWGPLDELWQLMAALCEVEVDYIAEEPGSDYFATEEQFLTAFNDLTNQYARSFTEAEKIANALDGIDAFEFATAY